MKHDEGPMSLGEMADYLKIARAKLEEMAETGGIPATRMQSQWRFTRSVVDDWLIDYMKRLGKEELRRLIASEGSPVSLKSLLHPAMAATGIRPGTKDQILGQLVDILRKADAVSESEADKLLSRLVDREEMVTTAIFPGVAIPHPRNPEEPLAKRPTVAVGVCAKGTEFDSLDMEPTYVFFLVCAGNEMVHLKLIAEIALHVRRRDLVERLRSCGTGHEVVSEIFAS